MKTVQIKVNGKWEDILPQRVACNDCFRVFEDGKLLVFPDGNTEQLAGQDAFVARDGTVFVGWIGLIKF